MIIIFLIIEGTDAVFTLTFYTFLQYLQVYVVWPKGL